MVGWRVDFGGADPWYLMGETTCSSTGDTPKTNSILKMLLVQSPKLTVRTWQEAETQKEPHLPTLVFQVLLLMVQKSGDHQLRLVVYPFIPLSKGVSYMSVWFFGISSINKQYVELNSSPDAPFFWYIERLPHLRCCRAFCPSSVC